MKRFAFVGAVALAAALIVPVDAGGKVPTPIGTVGSADSERIVEQQTAGGATQPDPALQVVNDQWVIGTGLSQNYRCIWDNDDALTGYLGDVTLLPGQSVTGDICYIADWGSHLWHLAVPAPLVGSITVAGATIPVRSGSEACVLYEYRDHSPSPALVPIADSNGGRGERMTVHFTLTNPMSKRVRGLHATFDVGLGTFWHLNEAWCPGIPHGVTVEQVGQHSGYDPILYWMD